MSRIKSKYSEYQNCTIDHLNEVFDYQDAYLVADEVGLGKTYVAKGLIEDQADRKQGKPYRVVYVASNGEIAKTNAPDLCESSEGHIKVVTTSDGRSIPFSRLSMLGHDARFPGAEIPVQIYALSPNTTFTGRGTPTGNRAERDLMQSYCKAHLNEENGSVYQDYLMRLEQEQQMDSGSSFTLEQVVATLRKELNDAAVLKMDPDLIILDEFHRFHSILNDSLRELRRQYCVKRLEDETVTKIPMRMPYIRELVRLYQLDQRTELDGFTLKTVELALRSNAEENLTSPESMWALCLSQFKKKDGFNKLKPDQRELYAKCLALLACKITPEEMVSTEYERFELEREFRAYLKQDPDAGGGYSFREMIEILNRKRDAEGRPHVKLLLLSATPYQYLQMSAKPAHKYEGDKGVTSDDKDPNRPFRNFAALKEYICQLNGLSSEDLTDPKDYYAKLLCRTQRNWLQEEAPGLDARQLLANNDDLMAYLNYELEYQRTFALPEAYAHLETPVLAAEKSADLSGKDEKSALAVSTIIASRIGASEDVCKVLGKPAYNSFTNLRSYLDEAPEYIQFSDTYRSINGGKEKGSEINTRKAICALLEAGNLYRLRKPAEQLPHTDKITPAMDVEPEWFAQTRGHFKWERLRREAMPQDCELRLWIPPILRSDGRIVEDNFSKTMVFAHYRLSTRAVAAFTSMEAQCRLNTAITVPRLLPAFHADAVDFLLDVFRREYGSMVDATLQSLRGAILCLFNTTHARRVLTAYGCKKQLDLNASETLLASYCREYDWDGMMKEYIQCLRKFGSTNKSDKKVSAELETIISVLSWNDRDMTRIRILPEWAEEGYCCSFGERYTEDYSDKSAHDEEESKDKDRKRRTTERLAYIQKRFQSPFFPFVLAASETAQEGVNLHNYCQKIVHWSIPSSLNAFVQEEGRVDRRCSLTIRKQMAWLWKHAGQEPDSLTGMFAGAGKACSALNLRVPNEDSGLFPMWFLPKPQSARDFPELRRIMLYPPLSHQREEYRALIEGQKEYSKFGIREKDRYIGEELLKDELCPLLVKKRTSC